MSRTVYALAAWAAALLTAEAGAQQPEAGATLPSSVAEPVPTEGVEELVVRGRRMSDIKDDLRIHIGEFIGQVAALPAGRGFARWQGQVCVGVHNLERSAAQYLVDRISSLALEVGLEPGEPGCRPEVIVIFTTDGKAMASYIVENQPTVLRPNGEGGTHLGLAGMDAFAASERAVRWWHLSMPVDARTGNMAIESRANDTATPLGVYVDGASRIHSGIRDALQTVVIIVDSAKLTGTTWQQLGDYLAMVSLAQIDPAAKPTTFDSILNLFTNPKAYSGLTDWDRSYVHALYAFDQRRETRLQRGEIVNKMLFEELDEGE